jgi:carboxylesterase
MTLRLRLAARLGDRFSLGTPTPGDGDKSPFFARAPGGRAVLCLHGFTGTPFEVRPLAEALAAQGFTVSAPLLAGHGHTPQALAATRWPDWQESAERALAALRAEVGGGPVAIAGFSLGGLLALRLSRLQPEAVGAVALMSVPLRLRPMEVAAVRAIVRLPRVLRRGPLAAFPKARGYDVVDEEMKRKNPGLAVLPLDAAHSLIELGEVVRRHLPQIRTPAFVAHGERDRTVPLEDSLELCGTLGAADIERLWLPESGHLLGIDVERRKLAEAIARFFTRHLKAQTSRPDEGGPTQKETSS